MAAKGKIKDIIENEKFLRIYNIINSKNKIAFLLIDDLKEREENEKEEIINSFHELIKPLHYLNKALEVRLEKRISLFVLGLLINYLYIGDLYGNDTLTILEEKIKETFFNELANIISDVNENAVKDQNYNRMNFNKIEQDVKVKINDYVGQIDLCRYVSIFQGNVVFSLIKKFLEDMSQYNSSSQNSNYPQIHSGLSTIISPIEKLNLIAGYFNQGNIIRDIKKDDDFKQFYSFFLEGDINDKIAKIKKCQEEIMEMLNSKIPISNIIEYFKDIIAKIVSNTLTHDAYQFEEEYYKKLKKYIINGLLDSINIGFSENAISSYIYNYSFMLALQQTKGLLPTDIIDDYLSEYKKLEEKIDEVNNSINKMSMHINNICNIRNQIQTLKGVDLNELTRLFGSSLTDYDLFSIYEFSKGAKSFLHYLIKYLSNFNIILNTYNEKLSKLSSIVNNIRPIITQDDLLNKLLNLLNNDCRNLKHFLKLKNDGINVINDYINNFYGNKEDNYVGNVINDIKRKLSTIIGEEA